MTSPYTERRAAEQRIAELDCAIRLAPDVRFLVYLRQQAARTAMRAHAQIERMEADDYRALCIAKALPV